MAKALRCWEGGWELAWVVRDSPIYCALHAGRPGSIQQLHGYRSLPRYVSFHDGAKRIFHAHGALQELHSYVFVFRLPDRHTVFESWSGDCQYHDGLSTSNFRLNLDILHALRNLRYSTLSTVSGIIADGTRGALGSDARSRASRRTFGGIIHGPWQLGGEHESKQQQPWTGEPGGHVRSIRTLSYDVTKFFMTTTGTNVMRGNSFFTGDVG